MVELSEKIKFCIVSIKKIKYLRQFEVIIRSSSACQIWGQAFHCVPENYVASMCF